MQAYVGQIKQYKEKIKRYEEQTDELHEKLKESGDKCSNLESLKEENIGLQADNKALIERVEVLSKQLQKAKSFAKASNLNAAYSSNCAYRAHLSATSSCMSARFASTMLSMHGGYMQAPNCKFYLNVLCMYVTGLNAGAWLNCHYELKI